MDGLGEAELFRTVRAQVEAVGGVGGFSDEEVQADLGLSQREYRRLGETLAFLEPQLRAALARGDLR